MAGALGEGKGRLSAQQDAMLEQMISEKLTAISNRIFAPYLSVIKSWQNDLDTAEDWFSEKITEYDSYTDTVIEQFKKSEGERLQPYEIVAHDHTYCLRPDIVQPTRSVCFVPHNCDFACWKKGVELPNRYDYNPLEVPLRLGWQRVKMNRINGAGVDVYYITPCGRRLRSLDEVQLFLDAVGNCIGISMFTFDPSCLLRTLNKFEDVIKVSRVLFYHPDISLGAEKIPISCINTHGSFGPDPFDYITERTHEPDVHIPTNPEFLVCCSCTDNCANRSRCECWQLTIQESKVVPGEGRFSVGYVHQRLNRPQHSAIYECNQYCRCNGGSCTNRVVQNGIQHRLQVFYTGKPHLGWGLRALDDIPKGSFICSYIGRIYTEQGAEEKAITLGDEYFADLDYIEVIEHHKENYEAEVAAELMAEAATYQRPPVVRQPSSRSISSSEWSSGSDDDSYSDGEGEEGDDGISSLFSEDLVEGGDTGETATPTLLPIDFDIEMDVECTDDIYDSTDSESSISPQPVPLASALSTPTMSRNNSLNNYDHQQQQIPNTSNCNTPPVSSGLPSSTPPRLMSPNQVPSTVELSGDGGGEPISFPSAQLLSPRKATGRRTRQYYGQNSGYIMDAKTKGNVGRYINHSCGPNMFVQNVFIDAHDLRFPWVAFFAKKRIKAMQELTWNYNYEVGSVENKQIHCLCGAPQCKGRLL